MPVTLTAPEPLRDVASLALSANERRVLDLVRRAEGTTRADITHLTQLTAQSISRIVESLENSGLIHVGERALKGRGQPSVRLHVNHDAAYGVGLSVMTDAISGVVMDLGGEVVAKDWLHLGATTLDAVLESCALLYERLLAKAGIAANQVVGVGTGVTGFFVGDGRKLNPPDPLGDLAMVELDVLLAESLQRPVWVDNDGNVAAIGESLCGVGLAHSNFAYVFFSLGLGGGVVIDGRVFPGAWGNAGEYSGILPIEEQPHRPTLELLRQMMSERGRHHPDIYDMIRHFAIDAPGVEEWIDQARPKVKSICSAIAAVIDPSAIVLGGRIPKVLADRLASDVAFDAMPRRSIEKPFPAILVSQVDGDATAIGAAATALKATLFT